MQLRYPRLADAQRDADILQSQTLEIVHRDDATLALRQLGERDLQETAIAARLGECRGIDVLLESRPVILGDLFEADEAGRRATCFLDRAGAIARSTGEPILSAELVEDGPSNSGARVPLEGFAAVAMVAAEAVDEAEDACGDQIVAMDVGG